MAEILPDGWRWALLGDVLRFESEVVHPRENPVGEATFVGLEHIEPGTGRRIGSETVRMEELTGRKPRFRAGNIVYGYLRPYLNKVWLADIDGLCSVDQYVYSVATEVADAEFVSMYMRSPLYLSRAPITKTPGQLPRIRKEEVAAVPIPLPELQEQRRIATAVAEQMRILDRARVASETQLATAEALPDAYLHEVFEGLGSRKWPKVRLGDVAALVNGSAYRESEWATSGVPIIRIQNLNDRSKSFNYWDGPLDNRVRVTAGDVLLAWSGTPGTSFGAHLWDREDGVLNQHIFRVDIDRARISPLWAVHAINQQLHRLIGAAQGAVGLRHVTKTETAGLQIPLPDLDEQRRLASHIGQQVDGARHLRELLGQQHEKLLGLPAALLRQAFLGQL